MKIKSLSREQLTKILTILLIAFIAVFSIITITDTSGEKKTVTSDETTEQTLCNILSDVDGVGAVDVMIEYSKNEDVVGVIVTAEGAKSARVKEELIKGVSSLFNIPTSNVTIYEKKKGGNQNEQN